MINKNVGLLLSLFVLTFVGCRNEQSSNVLEPTAPTSTMQPVIAELPQTSTPVLPPLVTPDYSNLATSAITLTSSLTQTTGLRHIVAADVRMIWWSSDSKWLFASGGGFTYYDVEEGSQQSFPEVSEMFTTTPFPILAKLPSYQRAYLSPSGERAIYLRFEDAHPTVTYDPAIEGGESPPLCGSRELWLWQNEQAYSLGKINHCYFDQHVWTPDEQKVILVEFGIPMITSPEGQAWLIDLAHQTSRPLFPRKEYHPVQIYGFTSDGSQLLYGFFSDFTGANLALLDMDSLRSIPLEAPVHSLPGNAFVYPTPQWIHEDKLLVQYRGSKTTPPYPIGVLDINSLEFISLTDMFPDKFIAFAVLSPDLRWLAFTTGEIWYPTEDLWLLEVNLGD